MHSAMEQEYVEYVTARMPALRRLAYALCGDRHRADDIVQQAITRLYAHWGKANRADKLTQVPPRARALPHLPPSCRPDQDSAWCPGRVG